MSECVWGYKNIGQTRRRLETENRPTERQTDEKVDIRTQFYFRQQQMSTDRETCLDGEED